MRILFVTYYFPPDSAVGALRPAKVVRALQSRGHDVQVVAAANGSMDARSNGVDRVQVFRNPRELYAAWRDRIRRPGVTSSADPHASDGRAIPHTLPGWKRYLFSLLWLPDDRQGFILPALWAARNRSGEAPFDLVYTSAPPFSVHLVGLLLNLTTGLRWIAEFRDPWLDGVPKLWHVRSALSDAADRSIERACLRRATEVVAVTHSAAAKIGAKRAALGAAAPKVVLNGIDHFASSRSVRAAGRIHAVHVGSLYHSRDPRPLLAAIAALRTAGELPERGILLEFIGDARWYGSISLHEIAESLKISDLVSVRDTVSHSEARQILEDADLLVLLAQQQPAQVPNKLYEYLGQQKPILAFADAAGETATMMRQSGDHFLVTEHDSDRTPAIVRSALQAAVDPDWRSNVGQLEQWTTDNQMRELVSFVENRR